jgi:hypothetical protein
VFIAVITKIAARSLLLFSRVGILLEPSNRCAHLAKFLIFVDFPRHCIVVLQLPVPKPNITNSSKTVSAYVSRKKIKRELRHTSYGGCP